MKKSKLYFKFLVIMLLTNILVACTDNNGNPVDFMPWVDGFLFGWEAGDAGSFTDIFSAIGKIVGGPYGWAAGIIGTAVPVYVKTRKTNKGLEAKIAELICDASQSNPSPEYIVKPS